MSRRDFNKLAAWLTGILWTWPLISACSSPQDNPSVLPNSGASDPNAARNAAEELLRKEIYSIEDTAWVARNSAIGEEGFVTRYQNRQFYNDLEELPYGQTLVEEIFAATRTPFTTGPANQPGLQSRINVPLTIDVSALETILRGGEDIPFSGKDLKGLRFFNLFGLYDALSKNYGATGVPEGQEFQKIGEAYNQISVGDRDLIRQVSESLPTPNLKGLNFKSNRDVFQIISEKMHDLYLAETDMHTSKSIVDSIRAEIDLRWNKQITISGLVKPVSEWFRLYEVARVAYYNDQAQMASTMADFQNSHEFNNTMSELLGTDWDFWCFSYFVPPVFQFSQPARESANNILDLTWASPTKGVYATGPIGFAGLGYGFVNPFAQKIYERPDGFYRRFAEAVFDANVKRHQFDNHCMEMFADTYDPVSGAVLFVEDAGLWGKYYSISNLAAAQINKLAELKGAGMMKEGVRQFLYDKVNNAINIIQNQLIPKVNQYNTTYNPAFVWKSSHPTLMTTDLQALQSALTQYASALDQRIAAKSKRIAYAVASFFFEPEQAHRMVYDS
ncbi:MAG: hypothetical protein HZC29_08100 [Thaumarchaeota archaeon]|nr:hypothetical protein [Nitrososphaerota archaeon]